MPNASVSTSRNKVLHDYHDHAQISFTSEIDTEGTKRRGAPDGVSFPVKVHGILSNAEQDGLSHILSWQPHGRSFRIHKPKDFVTQIMPIYFRQTKMTSFQRQLNLYGFSRITVGPDRGGYYHEDFLRYKRFLCQLICRTRIKGNGFKVKASPETEPDFYSMHWVKPKDESTSRALSVSPGGEASVARGKENKRIAPTKMPSSIFYPSLRKKKYVTKKYSKDDVSYSPPKKSSAVIAPSVTGSSETTTKKHLIFSSIGIADKMLYPQQDQYLISNREGFDIQNEKTHSGTETSSFEENHFDRLDILNRFILRPERETSATQHDGVGYFHSTHLSEICLSAVQSLREPILSPSSSLSSLSDMVQRGETPEINSETFFLSSQERMLTSHYHAKA